MKSDKSYILGIEQKKLKSYNNITNSMNTIFMNSQNSKTPDPPRRLLNLSDRINLKRKDKNDKYKHLLCMEKNRKDIQK